MNSILIIRLSAMGDVAMMVPILEQLLRQYPKKKFFLLTRSAFHPIFKETAPQIHLLSVDPFLKHGLWGIIRLFFFLKRKKISAVADLHNVLRTQVLKQLFRFKRVRWESIDKNREGRKTLTAKHKKGTLQALTPVYRLYQNVFERLNMPVLLEEHRRLNNTPKQNAIGFAPSSKHETKNWEASNNKKLIDFVLNHSQSNIFLFGDPNNEKELLTSLEINPDRVNTTFHLSLKEQLELISSLRVMVSMDSANMHLASAVGTPVISIWCSTSPLAGFLGFGQPKELTVEVDLDCRPCSIYGNKDCWRGDLVCTQIPIAAVTKKLHPFISEDTL